MTHMDRLDALLADADGILAELDAQTIDESLERGEAPDHDPDRAAEACPWCWHEFHGLPCHPPVEYLIATLQFVDPDLAIDDAALPVGHPAAELWPCRCDLGNTRLDDTWRPPFRWSDTTWLMHVTGLDGWSARLLFDAAMASYVGARRKWTLTSSSHAARPVSEHTGQVDCPACAHTDEQVRIYSSGGVVIIGTGGMFIDETDFDTVPVVPFRHDGGEMHFEATTPGDLRGYGNSGTVIDELELDDTPEHPAARALRLRQERNTGPERPPANRARRPRRHQ